MFHDITKSLLEKNV